jgi:tetratricopeptide (TPR) repeat protein
MSAENTMLVGNGQSEPAVQALLRTVQEMFSEAIQHHRVGHLNEAERLYQQVLAIVPRHGDSLHLLGLIAHQTGRFDRAAATIRQAIAVNATAPSYHFSLGNVLTAQGRLDEAVACHLRVLEIDPRHVDAHNNLGDVHAQQGRLDDAVVCYRRVLEIKPEYPGLHANLGNALKRRGRLDEAVVCYRKAIELDPASAAIQNNLGNTHIARGRPDEALACYQRALEIEPDYPEAYNNLGNALGLQGQLVEAITCFCRALELRPDYPDAYNSLGNALREDRRLEEAVDCYRRARDLKPDYPEAHYNLGNVLREQGQLDDAVGCFRNALDLRPDYVDAYINLGSALAEQRKLDEAAACYTKALQRVPDLPDAHFNRGLVLLAQGDLAAGWAEYEWRWKMPQMIQADRCFARPRWRGEAAEGQTLLIHAEQGFGDTIQFCRYARLAAERGLRVIMAVPKPLVRLLSDLPGADLVVDEGEALPDFDLYCPMLSLPSAIGTTIANIPSAGAYLRAEEALVTAWRARLATSVSQRPRVGLVWAGNPRNYSPALAAVDRRRSIDPGRLAAILQLPELHFFGLQKGGPAPPADVPLIDFMHEVTDFADTAALIANLDLVISVDTAVAHLAAAIGKPVWLLDRFDSCWRWLSGRRDSPWYPTLRLYRQPSPGDWDTVLAEVTCDLRDLACAHVETICRYDSRSQDGA